MRKGRLHITVIILMLITTFPAYGNGDQDVQTIKPDTVTVKVIGTNADSRFEPKEVQVRPGDTVRFEVVEGMHTVTAYHPDNRRELNIPPNAESFDSGILSAGDTWFLTIKQAGEYNYFCMPHERMGHIGKIISNKTTLKPTIYNN